MNRKIKSTAALFVLVILFISTGCEKTSDEHKTVTKAQIDFPAPDFVLSDMDGKKWNLSELKGKVVFLNFWASWCPPCRTEMSSMQDLYLTMKDKKFQMITVLYRDDPGKAAEYASSQKYTFPITVEDSSIANIYGITGVPETFIIDGKGILREKHIGPRQWNSPEALDMLKRYMTEQ